MHTPRSRTSHSAVLLTLLISLLLTLLLTLLPGAAITASAQDVQAVQDVQARDDYQRQARKVTNRQRVDHDLRRLKRTRCVQKYARRQARRMARRDRMFHQDLGVVLKRCDLRGVAENVAYGYPTGRLVVRAWMLSPGHRANLLNPHYRLLGLAVRRSEDGTPYAAQVFGRR